jgi:hypothetical protein
MMRRYILDMELCSVECESRGIVEHPDGEWVRWEDVIRVLKTIDDTDWEYILDDNAEESEG